MILGLSGNAGSGKDFIADILVEKHGFIKIAFADPIKRICQEVFDFSDEQLWGPSEKRNLPDKRYLTGIKSDVDEHFGSKSYLTPRTALQSLGTDWGRNCYNNVWINYTFKIIDKLLNTSSNYDPKYGYQPGNKKNNNVVITDVRFYNEMEAIFSRNGKVVRVVNDSTSVNLLNECESTHISEQEQKNVPLKYFHYILHNQKEDYDCLLCDIDKMLAKLRTM